MHMIFESQWKRWKSMEIWEALFEIHNKMKKSFFDYRFYNQKILKKFDFIFHLNTFLFLEF